MSTPYSRWVTLFTYLMWAAIITGCEPTSLDEGLPAEASVVPLAGETSTATTTEVSEMSWADVQKEIKTLDGRVVVVNIWTNTCAVCLAEFPAYAELSRRWTEDDVVFYDINCDYDGIDDKPPAFYLPQVFELHEKHPSASRHVALTDAFIDFLDDNDIRSTPTVLVYDQSGKLVKQFDNDKAYKEEDEFHADDVGTLVEQVLKKKS
ncbi:MAG: TlpA disulfide reductase family protein [Planctomycetota bacterium]|nr:TlpA disulfide reductase family protein [Planctomycetota bacterium]